MFALPPALKIATWLGIIGQRGAVDALPAAMGLHEVLAFGVAALEASVPILILASRRRVAAVLAFALSVLFALVLLARTWAGDVQPGCGCLGAVQLPLHLHIMMVSSMLVASRAALCDSLDQARPSGGYVPNQVR